MTRIFNDSRALKDDMVEGFVTAYSRYVRRVPSTSAAAPGITQRSAAMSAKVSPLLL